jgi:FKBP-type peptidyl-prolyl cis-trans isomerase FkpA
MKKILVVAISFLSLAASAQKTPAKKPASTPAKPVGTTLKTANDSVSYAIGMNLASFYEQQGLKNINPTLVAKAISDVYGKKKTALNDQQANLALMCYMNPALCQKVKQGENFLATNKNKAGVKTTASGLQYEVVKLGTGPKPVATDTVVVNYKGTLLDGTEFDNSYKRGTPISFPLNGVIRGWTEGLQLMPVGSTYKFYIPYSLAYGMNDNGPIPGGSVLLFDVELLEIKGK